MSEQSAENDAPSCGCDDGMCRALGRLGCYFGTALISPAKGGPA